MAKVSVALKEIKNYHVRIGPIETISHYFLMKMRTSFSFLNIFIADVVCSEKSIGT